MTTLRYCPGSELLGNVGDELWQWGRCDQIRIIADCSLLFFQVDNTWFNFFQFIHLESKKMLVSDSTNVLVSKSYLCLNEVDTLVAGHPINVYPGSGFPAAPTWPVAIPPYFCSWLHDTGTKLGWVTCLNLIWTQTHGWYLYNNYFAWLWFIQKSQSHFRHQ